MNTYKYISLLCNIITLFGTVQPLCAMSRMGCRPLSSCSTKSYYVIPRRSFVTTHKDNNNTDHIQTFLAVSKAVTLASNQVVVCKAVVAECKKISCLNKPFCALERTIKDPFPCEWHLTQAIKKENEALRSLQLFKGANTR